jgi:hypothetical protein
MMKKLRKDLESIKDELGIDLEKEYYADALWRHFARMTLLSTKQCLSFFEETAAMGLGDPLSDDEIAAVEEVKAEAAEILGRDSAKSWHDDQAIIEEFHLQRFGHLDHLMLLPACGTSAREMLAHHLDWSLRTYFEQVRREAEVRDIREALEAVCGAPVCLHVPSPFGMFHELSTCFRTPQFRDGTMGKGLELLYPPRTIDEALLEKTIVLEAGWREEEALPWSESQREQFENAKKQVETLELRWKIRERKGESDIERLVPTAPGVRELFEVLRDRHRVRPPRSRG